MLNFKVQLGAPRVASDSAAAQPQEEAAPLERVVEVVRSPGPPPVSDEEVAQRLGLNEAAALTAPLASAAASSSSSPAADRPAKVAVPFKVRTAEEESGMGINLFSAEELEKRRKRAERFGVPLALDQPVLQPELSEEEAKRMEARMSRLGPVTESFIGLEKLPEERYEITKTGVKRRWNAVHMYGNFGKRVTKDVFHFFRGLGPQQVEWINGCALNVVFQDANAARHALSQLSQRVPSELALLERIWGDKLGEFFDGAPRDDWQFLVWRRAAEGFLMRIASVEDVKLPPSMRQIPAWYREMLRKERRQSQKRGREEAPARATIKVQRTEGGARVITLKKPGAPAAEPEAAATAVVKGEAVGDATGGAEPVAEAVAEPEPEPEQ